MSAVVLRDENGAVLTVRKRGTDQFMFPGGKIEPGETAVAAAVREIAEELATELDPTRLQLLGTFSARAANEPDWDVEATVYTYPLIPITGPAHEIEELRWQLIDEYQHSSDLPPLLVDHVFPLLRAGGKCR
ncbi:MAG: NUDIX domain-containing protein [Mycobacteriaceae bacterium]|nr:NUDIX domain-containing protein [Mycobacteriaceae bacterium]